MDKEYAPARPKKKKRKKLKGKAAKKQMPQDVRLEKSRGWVAAYTGNNILKDYRKKFATDRMQTIDDLQKLGLTFTEEQIEKEKRAVQAYQQQQIAKKKKRILSIILSMRMRQNGQIT